MPSVLLSLVLMCSVLGFHNSAEAFRKSSSCNKTELRLKNCALETKPYQIHFTHDKILINDGVWRGIVSLPLVGEKSQWEKIQTNVFGSSFYVQLEIWDEPKGAMQVQSLQWIVMEVKGSKLNELFRKVLQKRQPVPGDEQTEGEAQKFKFDKKVNYGLTKVKDHGKEKVIWKYRTEQAELK